MNPSHLQVWALPFLCLTFFVACTVISALDFSHRRTVESCGLLTLSIIGVVYACTWLVITWQQSSPSRPQTLAMQQQQLPVHHQTQPVQQPLYRPML
jgi:uncharacterized membrane protein (DUF4010 family)